MNNKILNLAKKSLQEKKSFVEKIADDNLFVALQNPEFKDVYQNIKLLTLKKAKIEFENEQKINKKNIKNEINTIKSDLSLINKQINDLTKKQNDLLNKLNIKNILPEYTCKNCCDTGVVNGKYCKCINKEISNILMKNSGITHKLKCFDDINFDLCGDKKNDMKKLSEILKTWCNKNSEKTSIILSGQTGVGKTFLMECMANELIENQKYVCYTTAFGLNQNLLKYHTTFDNTKDVYLEPYLDCDVLLIDDLGTEQILKNVTLDYFYHIVNERQNEGKAIIITTNLDLEGIYARYGERISSRLFNKQLSLLLEIKNKDLRIK